MKRGRLSTQNALGSQPDEIFTIWQRRIFFLLWITYASFYLGRVNFSVAIPGLMEDFGWTRTSVGGIGTALFWAYAIGQFINGQLGDRIGARVMITIGITTSALMNLLFGFSQAFGVMILVWAINGYAQSMGWAPTVKTLANWFHPRVRGKMSGWLGTSYILGGAASVALAGFLASQFGWRTTFFIPCALLLISGVHWYLRARNSPESAGLPSLEELEAQAQPLEKTGDRSEDTYLGLRYTLKSVLGNSRIWMMGVVLFFVNIVRYGFLTWAPTYLFEVQGAAIDKAAYSSVVFPLAGALGAVIAGWATDRWFQSRRAPIGTISLFLTGVLAWAYRFLVPVDQWLLGLITLAAIGFTIFSAHILIVAAAPMDFGTRKAASSATGFIDGWGYIGAGFQGFFTGLLVDIGDWNTGFIFWIVCAILGAVTMLLMWGYKPPQREYL